ncbi:MAG: thioredoxin-dependent thiol peroxidase [Candidatus Zambryskibacteria bacterium]|nr:thioredoxin-dependent thiol peroxidase [Candidatus Zambryskibacteria bacterium]
MTIRVGLKAPDFSLPDQNGKVHKLSTYKGKWVLLYFYPKDDTPGCTIEACTIRDQFQDFKKIKAVVLGVSKDSVESHKKFADTYKLPFTILSDEDKKIIKKYGVWGEKILYGKKYVGVNRTSFLIGPDGKVKKVYQNVKPPKHAEEVLRDIKEKEKIDVKAKSKRQK